MLGRPVLAEDTGHGRGGGGDRVTRHRHCDRGDQSNYARAWRPRQWDDVVVSRGNEAVDNDKPNDSDEPEREYWLVRVLKFIGNLIAAVFIHSTP